jgi:hypothetical protein
MNEHYFGGMERCTKQLREIYDPFETMKWLLAKQERLGGLSAAQLIADARIAEVERVIDELKNVAAQNAEHRPR